MDEVVAGFVFIILSLVGFIIWKEHTHRKLIESLTNKIMARSLTEYQAVTRSLSSDKGDKKDNKVKDGKKPVFDPVLGKNY